MNKANKDHPNIIAELIVKVGIMVYDKYGKCKIFYLGEINKNHGKIK